MFRLYQMAMLGPVSEKSTGFIDIKGTDKLALALICVMIIVIGVYPKPILNLSEASVQALLEQINQKLTGVN